VPELSRNIRIRRIKLIFELRVALAKEFVERGPVFDVVEVKWLSGTEDRRMFREIPVMWVVEAVWRRGVSYSRASLGR
jgi:hypothetical protein